MRHEEIYLAITGTLVFALAGCGDSASGGAGGSSTAQSGTGAVSGATSGSASTAAAMSSGAGSTSGGLSSMYPGDVGIENDPNVVWTENFEEGSVAALYARYDD